MRFSICLIDQEQSEEHRERFYEVSPGLVVTKRLFHPPIERLSSSDDYRFVASL
jgi:hypothetical protein